jgi:hypothetical protein
MPPADPLWNAGQLADQAAFGAPVAVRLADIGVCATTVGRATDGRGKPKVARTEIGPNRPVVSGPLDAEQLAERGEVVLHQVEDLLGGLLAVILL